MADDFVVETFRCPSDLSGRLSFFSSRYDISKSQLIRAALEHRLDLLENLEETIERSVIQRFLNKHISTKDNGQS